MVKQYNHILIQREKRKKEVIAKINDNLKVFYYSTS